MPSLFKTLRFSSPCATIRAWHSEQLRFHLVSHRGSLMYLSVILHDSSVFCLLIELGCV